MPKWSALAFCILLAAATLASAEPGARRYVETHGGASQPIEYGVAADGEMFRVTAVDDGSSNLVRWSPAAGTIAWHWKDTVKRTELDGERVGDVIRLHGTIGEKPFTRELKIDAAPWYQIFGPVLQDLLPGVQGQREFWVVNPDDGSAHKMQVRRVGAERLTLNGAAVPAVKVHFSPAGALAPFWGADYWLREADSVYVYSRLPENGGLTVTTIEDPAR
ncbi:MAG TPA: hypothetical protein VHE79_03460 [Spirochaetia bacterium]